MSHRAVRAIVLVVALVAASLVAPPAAASATRVVCPSGCAYASIQVAVSDSAAGDTVLVEPGLYPGAVTIDRAITLCSTTRGGSACDPTPAETTLDGAGALYTLFVAQGGVLVRGFTVQNPTLAMTDQTAGGAIDPSLVVVFGADDVTLRDNHFRLPAAPPVAATSRWIVDVVNVAADASGARSDRVRILDNVFTELVEAQGPDGTCANAPCRLAAIDLWGAGAAPGIEGNDITLPLGQATSPMPRVVGIWGDASDAQVRNNTIRSSGESIAGMYGVKGAHTRSVFADNAISGALHGLFLAGSDLVVRDNALSTSSEGLRITASASLIRGNTFENVATAVHVAAPGGVPEGRGLVFRENVFGAATRKLAVHAQVTGVAFDLRENDWGVYEPAQIELFLDDASGTNTFDFSCYIAADGVRRHCPRADFTISVSGASWPRQVRLTDTTDHGANAFRSREWTLPGGSATTQTVLLSLGPGTYGASLRVVDDDGYTDARTRVFALQNAAPTLAVDSPPPASEGSLYELDLDALDGDGDALAYSLATAPAGMTIHPATGLMRWTPTHAQAGSHAVTARATDGAAAASASFTVVVADVPAGPALDAIAPLSILNGTLGTRTVRATSASGAVPVLAATGLPPAATFTDHTNGTATFAWTPGSADVGTYPIEVTATAEGITVARVLQVSVTEAAGIELARISPGQLRGSPGQTFLVKARVTNTGTGADVATFTATTTKPWPAPTPAPVALARGESAEVTVAITIPAQGDAISLTLKACSQAKPTLCKEHRTRVEAPIEATVTMDAATFGALQTPSGVVTVRFLDGSPAAGVRLAIEERADVLTLLRSTTNATTDAAGRAAFRLSDPRASTPGDHSVSIVARGGDVLTTAKARYAMLV